MKLHRFSKSGKLLYTIEKETEMSDKTLLPGYAQQIKKQLGMHYTGKAQLDVDRLLQALETALGKVERAKGLLQEECCCTDGYHTGDDGTCRSCKTLKELEE